MLCKLYTTFEDTQDTIRHDKMRSKLSKLPQLSIVVGEFDKQDLTVIPLVKRS